MRGGVSSDDGGYEDWPPVTGERLASDSFERFSRKRMLDSEMLKVIYETIHRIGIGNLREVDRRITYVLIRSECASACGPSCS